MKFYFPTGTLASLTTWEVITFGPRADTTDAEKVAARNRRNYLARVRHKEDRRRTAGGRWVK